MTILRLFVKNNSQGCPSFEATSTPINALENVFPSLHSDPNANFYVRLLPSLPDERIVDLSSVLNTKRIKAFEERYVIIPSPRKIKEVMEKTFYPDGSGRARGENPTELGAVLGKTYLQRSFDIQATGQVGSGCSNEAESAMTKPGYQHQSAYNHHPNRYATASPEPQNNPSLSNTSSSISSHPNDPEDHLFAPLSSRRVIIKPFEIMDHLLAHDFKYLGSHVEGYGQLGQICDVHTFLGPVLSQLTASEKVRMRNIIQNTFLSNSGTTVSQQGAITTEGANATAKAKAKPELLPTFVALGSSIGKEGDFGKKITPNRRRTHTISEEEEDRENLATSTPRMSWQGQSRKRLHHNNEIMIVKAQ